MLRSGLTRKRLPPGGVAVALSLAVVAAAPGALADLSGMSPAQEIFWGGVDETTPQAVGKAFPDSSQSVSPVAVADLDGDGFPEILFTTHCANDFTSNGTLRAIHGGGPDKGEDYFARCGTTLWQEGDAPGAVSCACADGVFDPSAGVAIGDLDADGEPEIVALSEDDDVHILSHDGTLESSFDATWPYNAPMPTLANLDHQGLAEIVVGKHVFSLAHDLGGNLVVLDAFAATTLTPTAVIGKISCLADLSADPGLEIVVGQQLLRWPQPPPGVTQRADCTGSETDPDQVAWCAGQLLVVWNAAVVNGIPSRDGFCVVADVLGVSPSDPPGPANPLDGEAEVVSISNGELYIFEGATGVLRRQINAGNGTRGGAPVVDDLDGDGFPEIAAAFSTRYEAFDLQATSAACPLWPNTAPDATPLDSVNSPRVPPVPGSSCTSDAACSALAAGTACNEVTGACVCLHNGWIRTMEDDSSQATGTSSFDFDADGAAETLYRDECWWRLYDGLDGRVWLSERVESRTRAEYPLVADVDADGEAEVVFTTDNESGFCTVSTPPVNNGLEVWGDAASVWGSARGIWSQFAHAGSDVGSDARIPPYQAKSWLPLPGHSPYNAYRAALPGPTLALYRDPAYTNILGEVDTLESHLAGLGRSARPFTGTSGAEWAEGLAEREALIVPLLTTGMLIEGLAPEARAQLRAFVASGGGLVQHRGSVTGLQGAANFLNGVFGFSLVEDGGGNPSTLDAVGAAGTAFAPGPPSLALVSDLDNLQGPSLPASGRAIYGFGVQSKTVALLPLGAGQISYLGLDWLDGGDDDWHTVLGLALEQVAVTPIPEPPSAAALASGAAALAALHRARRRRARTR